MDIYLLRDPRKEKLNWIRYLGKTNDLNRREGEHKREKGEIPKCQWVEKLLKKS